MSMKTTDNDTRLSDKNSFVLTHEQEIGSVEDSVDAFVSTQIALESGHQIRYRSCSWQKVS